MPRWRKARLGRRTDSIDTFLGPGAGDDIGAEIVVALAAVVFVFVLIPLLLLGFELILIGLAIAAGAFARTLLGRAWVVQAQQVGSAAEPLSWQVSGWRRSNRVIGQVSDALGAGLDPASAAGAGPGVLRGS